MAGLEPHDPVTKTYDRTTVNVPWVRCTFYLNDQRCNLEALYMSLNLCKPTMKILYCNGWTRSCPQLRYCFLARFPKYSLSELGTDFCKFKRSKLLNRLLKSQTLRELGFVLELVYEFTLTRAQRTNSRFPSGSRPTSTCLPKSGLQDHAVESSTEQL